MKFLWWVVATLLVWRSNSSFTAQLRKEIIAHEQARRDRVEWLPGQTQNASFQHFAGYVTVNETAGRALFYWLTEATHRASSKPLVLWLNGGPGCSSIAYGAMQEIGPFHINSSGIYLNRFSWNKVANILFLESPAGVGFSYSNTSSDLQTPGDKSTAKDAYVFLEHWLERFPKYKHRDFYLTGESYAGHYVPQLAKVIYEKNKDNKTKPFINLKGYMVGNALLDHTRDRLGRIDYWWTHALISHQTYTSIVRSCNLKGHTNGSQDECNSIVQYAVQHELGSVDPYDIYAPVCLRDPAAFSTKSNILDPLWRAIRFDGYDPCGDDYVGAYFNRADVQQAVHANVTGIPYAWTGCSETINNNWQDSEATMLPIYKELIKAGLRVWVYSGDVDSVVPVTSSRYSIEKLNLTITTPWYPWYRNQQVGGYTEIYEGLTMVTIRGAGHEVPMFQPGRAYSLIKHFLAGKPMPPQS